VKFYMKIFRQADVRTISQQPKIRVGSMFAPCLSAMMPLYATKSINAQNNCMGKIMPN